MIIGLTGLIGSGKSTVAEIFMSYGITVIDTDKIAHELTRHDINTLNEISNVFGDDVFIDNVLDRQKLRQVVFADDSSRRELENILHPRIYQEVVQQLKANNNGCYQIVAVPLLFRSPKYLELVKRTIFVDSNYNLLLQRLKNRSGLEKKDVDAILEQQVAREQQLNLADDVITNNENLDSLEQQVKRLHRKYIGMESHNQ